MVIENKGKTTLDKPTKNGQKKTKSNPKGAGRTYTIDENKLQKLEEGFMIGLTDDEACLYADVPTSTFYDYQNKIEGYKERKEQLKRTPNIEAKKVWKKEIIGGNYQASKEWLERRAKDEFSLKTETDNKNTNLNLDKDVDDYSDEELLKIING